MRQWFNGRLYSIVDMKHAVHKALDKEPEIQCGHFFCEMAEAPACCAVCPRFLSCDAACLNSPEKCGLVLEEK